MNEFEVEATLATDQSNRRLSWISLLSVKTLTLLPWQASSRFLYGLSEIKGLSSCTLSLQRSPHLFIVRGHLGVLISQMGKKGIEGKVIFLVTVRYAHHWFPDIFRSLPSIFFFCHSFAPPTTSFSLSLTPSLSFNPRGAEVVEGHSDLARFQHGGSEKGRENETTSVQQCTVNTFAFIKLVKNALIGAPGVHWQKPVPRHPSLHPSATH